MRRPVKSMDFKFNEMSNQPIVNGKGTTFPT